MGISKLTQDQQKIYQGFITFLLDPNLKNLIIQGSAGTGKTFLTKYLILEGIPNYRAMCKTLGIPDKYQDFEVTATTNKAVETLERQIPLPQNKEFCTITSLLGLRVSYNSSLRKQTLVPNDQLSSIQSNKIIFIDECSMINSELFNFINERCNNCKIVYIGDKYQLPPVKEKISPIYNCNYPELTLTQPVRNAGNPALMTLCEQLKNTCETGVWKDIHSVAGSIEVIKDGETWQKIIDKAFTKFDYYQRILAYSNNLVSNYAEYLMQLRGETDYLVPSSVYSSNAYYSRKSANNIINLHVDSLVTLVDIDKDVSDDIYKSLHINVDEGKAKNILSKVTVYSPTLHKRWIDVTFSKPEYYQSYMKQLYKQSPAEYYSLSKKILDLRMIEATTVHKAQGSTLDTVYIDLDDISKCTQKDLTAKLLYVAVSRAKNKVVFFGDLAKRYGVSVM